MTPPQIILLERRGILVSDRQARFPGGTVDLARVQRAWILTRRPGLPTGAALAALGALLLLRGAGPVRLVGALVAAYGVYLARSEHHLLLLQIENVAAPQVALSTNDGGWAREVLAAVHEAILRKVDG